LLLQQQQATEAQRQTNELLVKRLEAMEKAQEERANRPAADSHSSSRLPKFDGSHFKGESGTVEGWIREARLLVEGRLGDNEQNSKKAVAFLAQGFKEQAAVWYLEELSKSASPPQSPDALYAAIRSRYQPVLAAEAAFAQLGALVQGKLSVPAYASKLRELLALVPANSFSDTALMQQFRRGLAPSIRSVVVNSAEPPSSLDALITTATRIEENAKTGSTVGVAAMEVEQPGSSSSPPDSKLMLAALTSIQQTLQRNGTAGTGGRREGAGGSRGREKSRGRRVLNPKLDKQSREQRGRLMDQGRCIYCAAPDHLLRDCPVSAAGKDPTPAALGN
jgi:hypothetical protein